MTKQKKVLIQKKLILQRVKGIITVPKKVRRNSVFTKTSRMELAKNPSSPFRKSLPKSFTQARLVKKNLPLKTFFFHVQREGKVINNGCVRSVATIVVCLYLRKVHQSATQIHVWKNN